MKTTIDIPDELYRRAKSYAVEQGETLMQVVLASLERALATPAAVTPPEAPKKVSYWANRSLHPEFRAAQKAGAFRPRMGDSDITELISEDRDGR